MPRQANIAHCYICDQLRPCEREHVWPARLGGQTTAPACESCRDALDRMRLDDWDMGELGRGVEGLVAELGVKWHVGMAKLDLALGLKQCARLCAAWPRLHSDARLYGLKLMRIFADVVDVRGEPACVKELVSTARRDAVGPAGRLPA